MYEWDLDSDGVFGETANEATRGDEVGQSVAFSAIGLEGPTTIQVTLRVTDELGATDSASADISVNAINDPPMLANNSGLTLDNLTTATITSNSLSATDVDNSANELVYTLTSAPSLGELLLNGDLLNINETFTQQDIDDGLVSYSHNGSGAGDDAFEFTLTDGVELLGPTSFDITIVAHADLIVEAVTAPAEALSAEEITVSWRVRNNGSGPTDTTTWIDRVVLSADEVLDASDVDLARIEHAGALTVGGTYTVQRAVILPGGIEGDFHVFVITDAEGNVAEGDAELNNAGRTITPIAVTRSPEPDLQVTAVTAPSEAQPGQIIAIDWTVTNAGPGPADGPWVDAVYLSVDGTLNNAVLLDNVSSTHNPDTPNVRSASLETAVPTVAAGSYQILVVSDGTNVVFETDESNNQGTSSPIQIGIPDLDPTINNVAPTTLTSGSTVSIDWSVQNTGSAAASVPGRTASTSRKTRPSVRMTTRSAKSSTAGHCLPRRATPSN